MHHVCKSPEAWNLHINTYIKIERVAVVCSTAIILVLLHVPETHCSFHFYESFMLVPTLKEA